MYLILVNSCTGEDLEDGGHHCRSTQALNEYKQYFLLPLQPKATSLKKEGEKGELSQVVGDPS